MRKCRQQRIAQPFRFHFEQRVLSHADVVHALQRDRDQRREGVEELPLFRDAQQAPISSLDRQHTSSLGGRAQWNIEDFAARQGIGAESGRLAPIERPLGGSDLHCQPAVVALGIGARGAHQQASAGVRQQQRRARAECALNRLVADFHHLFDLHRPGQVSRYFKQRARPFLAMRGHARLKSQARRQLSGDQTHRQHDAEGQQVLHVGDGKRKARRHKEKIKRANA